MDREELLQMHIPADQRMAISGLHLDAMPGRHCPGQVPLVELSTKATPKTRKALEFFAHDSRSGQPWLKGRTNGLVPL